MEGECVMFDVYDFLVSMFGVDLMVMDFWYEVVVGEFEKLGWFDEVVFYCVWKIIILG